MSTAVRATPSTPAAGGHSPAAGNLTMRQLEVFAMASQCVSFTQAARRLGISQPSLSSTIAKVEAQLGVPLFDRTSRTKVLTPQGERLARVADELVRNFKASLEHVRGDARRQRGRLSIAVIPSVAAAAGPRALLSFGQRYPDFEVGLRDVAGEAAVEWVLDRSVDCAIVAAPSQHRDLRLEPLRRDRFELVCPRGHPLSVQASPGWADIDAAGLILAGKGGIHRDVERAWMADGARVRPRYEIDQIMTGLALVAAGLGVTILPGICRLGGAYAELVSLPLERIVIEREIVAAWRSDRVLAEPVLHLLHCFRQALTAAG